MKPTDIKWQEKLTTEDGKRRFSVFFVHENGQTYGLSVAIEGRTPEQDDKIIETERILLRASLARVTENT
jgi:hypothetical protein